MTVVIGLAVYEADTSDFDPIHCFYILSPIYGRSFPIDPCMVDSRLADKFHRFP